MIRRLEHVAVSVSDLDRSVAFYRDVLGFTLARLIELRDDAMLGGITGMPGARARIAHMRMGESLVELFEYMHPRGRPVGDRTQADLGCSHIGLKSDDVRADCHALRGRGVRFVSDPVEFRPGVWVAYFSGPDGETCELREDPEAP